MAIEREVASGQSVSRASALSFPVHRAVELEKGNCIEATHSARYEDSFRPTFIRNVGMDATAIQCRAPFQSLEVKQCLVGDDVIVERDDTGWVEPRKHVAVERTWLGTAF
jgi:hypothetical protein